MVKLYVLARGILFLRSGRKEIVILFIVVFVGSMSIVGVLLPIKYLLLIINNPL